MAAPRFKVRWEGLNRLRRQLRAEKPRFIRAVKAALFEQAEAVMTEAKRLTPVDEGVLRSSGHVQIPKHRDGVVFVELGFGGPAGSGTQGETNVEDVGYAVYVHEDLTARHTVGQAKYLEVPVDQARAGVSRRLARRVRQDFLRRG